MTDCIFCKIAKGELSSDIIYEDDKVLAFRDLDPQAPVHILIIPKEHIESSNFIDEDNSNIIAHIFVVINKLAKKLGIADEGYRVVNNCGENGGQTVPHLHFHLLGSRKFSWPPG